MEKSDNDQISLEAFFLRPYIPDNETNNTIIIGNTKKRKREEVQDSEMDLIGDADEGDVEGVTTLLKNYRIVTYVTHYDGNPFERIRGRTSALSHRLRHLTRNRVSSTPTRRPPSRGHLTTQPTDRDPEYISVKRRKICDRLY
eukprot:TRINITY_DN12175_c0_g1_i1.p1 TRINITY_DN12175_c0_g1~~TRINITY_DN12175_c0_g1_i1.p1  ORF type:complete len:143 (-),score=4.81 TRINITY_DN12175_c0_g1_i1:63-491(-)